MVALDHTVHRLDYFSAPVMSFLLAPPCNVLLLDLRINLCTLVIHSCHPRVDISRQCGAKKCDLYFLTHAEYMQHTKSAV